jgi:hypothetical protein
VVEINGAVDFTDDYALDGQDVFALAVDPFLPHSSLRVPERPAELALPAVGAVI